MSLKNKKIVCIGGGSALTEVVLTELSKYPVKITSITSMLENGGSTGQLRKDLDILPPGDLSRHLISLSEAPKWKKELFYLRFGKEKFPGGHVGHRFGTVFMALLENTLGDFEKALKVSHEFLEVKKHKALPATLEKTHLWATLENGKDIKGEDEIDVPKKHSAKLKIKKVFVKPKAKAYKPALDAIKKADVVVIGPGDLYSSLIASVLFDGMKQAFRKSKAKKIFICNAVTKKGETDEYSVKDFTKEIERYMGVKLDYVIYSNIYPSIEKYKKNHPEVSGITEINKNLPKDKFIGRNTLRDKNLPGHDSKKIIKIITSLI